MALPAVETTEPTGERAEFSINSETAANWLLQKLANIEAEQRRVKAQAEEIINRLRSDAERLQYLYGAQLEDFCRVRLAEGKNRRRSVAFLQGTCGFRTVPASIKITDMEAALLYAEGIGRGVKTVLDANFYRGMAEEALRGGSARTGVLFDPLRKVGRVDGDGSKARAA